MRNLEGLEVGILVGVAALVLFLAGFWLPKPFTNEFRLVVLHGDSCQLVRYTGMPVKDAGHGLCSTWAKLSTVSIDQVELEFATPNHMKTTITMPIAQVAGYIRITDR